MCHHSFNFSHIRAKKHFLVEIESNEERSKEHKNFDDYAASKVSNKDCPKMTKMMTNNDDTSETPPSLLVTKGVNHFGRLLFRDLEKYTNLVFSPFSLSTALAMLTTGAKGKTLPQVKFPLKKFSSHIFPPTLLFLDKSITFSSLSSGNHDRVQVYSVNK